MKKILLSLITLAFLVPSTVYAQVPVSWYRDVANTFIRPLNILDVVRMNTFQATSTTGTSLVAGNLQLGGLVTAYSTILMYGTSTASSTVATQKYVQSRDENLITNGSGLLGNNYNFSSQSFDPTQTFGGGGSFLRNCATCQAFSDELIPIDPMKAYRLSAWGRSGEDGGTNYTAGNTQYLGVAIFDIDGLGISPQYFMRHVGSATTTLADALEPGDTVVLLNDSTGWYNAGANAFQRQFTWYPYTNSFGYSYPNYTYSRKNTSNNSGYNSSGAWAASGISGTTITLSAPWPAEFGTLATGTPVMNSSSGGTYKYIAASAVAVPNTWTKYSGYISGLDSSQNNDNNRFPYGASYLRLLFLFNYHGVANNNIRWSNLSFTERTAYNLEVATASIPGVVSTTTQTFGGLKNFANNVGIGSTTPWGSLSITNTGSQPSILVEDSASPDTSPFTITESGSVGVGTTSPIGNLSISSNSTPIFGIQDTSAPSGSRTYVMRINPFQPNAPLQILPTNDTGSAVADTISIDRTGDLGIGTTTPWARLSVTNVTTNPSFLVEDSSSPDSSPLVYDSEGRLGVGTSSPARALDVYGNTSINSVAQDATLQVFGLNGGIVLQGSNVRNNATRSLLIQTSGGSVGIATSSPWRTFSVTGSAVMAGGPFFFLGASNTSIAPDTDATRQYFTFRKDLNDYTFGTIENRNGGANASADFIWNNDRTTSVSYYADAGFSSTAFNNPAYGNLNLPNSWYLYNTDGALQFYTATTSSAGFLDFGTGGYSSSRMRILSDGKTGIGTTTPVANLQATHGTANSTTTIEFGRSGQNKGTCIKLYDEVGTPYYLKVATGGTLNLSATACASVLGF